MPTYDYECTKCEKPYRTEHAMSDDKPDCPACGGSLKQAFLIAPAVTGGSSNAGDFASCDTPNAECSTGTCPFQQ